MNAESVDPTFVTLQATILWCLLSAFGGAVLATFLALLTNRLTTCSSPSKKPDVTATSDVIHHLTFEQTLEVAAIWDLAHPNGAKEPFSHYHLSRFWQAVSRMVPDNFHGAAQRLDNTTSKSQWRIIATLPTTN